MSVGNLLEMVQCPRCHSFEWTSEDLTLIHGNTAGETCALQDNVLARLVAATEAGDTITARKEYLAGQRLHIMHLDEYTFTLVFRHGLSHLAMFGVDTHRYVGSYNTKTKQLFSDLNAHKTDVCACGFEAPGINPRTGVYDNGVNNLARHIKENS